MNLGSLCTIATLQPGNFALVIWDNQVHMTTGGQPTATAHRSSLAHMARGAGIEKVLEPRDEAELGHAFDRILSEEGPFVVPVKIRVGRSEGGLSRDVIGSARRFRQALAAVPAVR
jgi:sulfopyruvate decarboxylase subunit beta